MKVCVYGAGAVGGHLAARLAEGGAVVSLIARGAHLAAIQSHGLRVNTLNRVYHCTPTATDDPYTLGHQDVVIVTVKAPALPAIVNGLQSLIGKNTIVVFVLNGIPWWYSDGHSGLMERASLERIDPSSVMQGAIGPNCTVGAVAYTACTVIAPGVIQAENPRNRLILGRPDGTPDARLDTLAKVLVSGGLEIEISDRIRDAVWTKLINNLVGGSLAVVTGSAMKDAMSSPAVKAAAHLMAQETRSIARALDCDTGDFEESLRKLATSAHKQSILQDLELGRSMEVDAILQAPMDLARFAGVATPTLDLVVDLAVQRAKAAGLYVDTHARDMGA